LQGSLKPSGELRVAGRREQQFVRTSLSQSLVKIVRKRSGQLPKLTRDAVGGVSVEYRADWSIEVEKDCLS
jgi:hypothetical protein